MNEYSENGYEYLGRDLARQGYIVASIDENFLNYNWDGDYALEGSTLRGWLILKHLEQWRAWEKDAGNLFYHKVDMNNIALVGHSRGGLATNMAYVINRQKKYIDDAGADLDFGFSIKGLVSISPLGYNDMRPKIENVNYLLLVGAHDQDIYYADGIRDYNRVSFADSAFHFKSFLYVYRANHGQFNTLWGRKDRIFPNSAFLNTAPIMEGDAQRKIAMTYISAFLNVTLKGNANGMPMLKDYRTAIPGLLPRDYYISQYDDSSLKHIADYNEDMDVTTASVPGIHISCQGIKSWKEVELKLRDIYSTPQNRSAVLLAWDKSASHGHNPSYTLTIDSAATDDFAINRNSALFFSIGKETDMTDFSIELGLDNGTTRRVAFSSVFNLPPLLKTKLSKFDRIYRFPIRQDYEQLLQYVEIPFSQFGFQDKDSSGLSGSLHIRCIRFVFDKHPSGTILLSGIGLK